MIKRINISKADLRFIAALVAVTVGGLIFSSKAYAINKPDALTSKGVIYISEDAQFDARDLYYLYEYCK